MCLGAVSASQQIQIWGKINIGKNGAHNRTDRIGDHPVCCHLLVSSRPPTTAVFCFNSLSTLPPSCVSDVPRSGLPQSWLWGVRWQSAAQDQLVGLQCKSQCWMLSPSAPPILWGHFVLCLYLQQWVLCSV